MTKRAKHRARVLGYSIAVACALAAMALLAATATQARGDERSECEKLAPKYGAQVEARLWDSTRVDLLTETHAIEADWPHKWAEAIGQASYYAELTRKRPGVLLLVSDARAQARYIYRAQTVCARLKIDLFIERVEPTPAEPPKPPAQLPGQEKPAQPGPDQPPRFHTVTVAMTRAEYNAFAERLATYRQQHPNADAGQFFRQAITHQGGARLPGLRAPFNHLAD